MPQQQVALRHLKNRIAQPLIWTVKNGSDDNWKIVIDEYDRIFSFKYRPSNGEIKLIRIQKK